MVAGGKTTMPTDTVSIAQFIETNHITMTAVRADRNPNMEAGAATDTEKARVQSMDHWKCTLAMGRSRMTVYFSQGYGHNGAEPELAGVLSCLASDSSSADQDFENWCSELGYDTDSRKAEKTYKAVQHQYKRLQRFLDSHLLTQLLYHTEPL